MKATVILYKSKTLSNGEHPLMIRIADRGKKKFVSLNISLPESRWNFKTNNYKPRPIPKEAPDTVREKILKEDAAIIARIDEERARYSAKLRELAVDRKTVSIDSLQEQVEKPVNNEYTLLKWFEYLIEEFRATDSLGQIRIYKSGLYPLREFLKDKDITFNEVDLAFLHRYENFLKRRKLKTATFSLYMRTLRAALNKAIKMGYAKNYPFSDYKIPIGEPNRRALNIEDMEAIIKLNQDNDFYRAMLFSYYTVGMNWVDLCRLTWNDIKTDEIRYIRQKIHHKMKIPIHDKAAVILKHYKPITGKSPEITGLNMNYVFPFLNRDIHKTEQQIADRVHKTIHQFNTYLKIIGQLAGTEIPLTSYVLRHSAITHLIRKGVTIDAIQDLAGHKKMSTTQGYIKDSSIEQKRKAISNL